jgi:hypothetical protein
MPRPGRQSDNWDRGGKLPEQVEGAQDASQQLKNRYHL